MLGAAMLNAYHALLQVYDALDGSEGFYSNRVDPTYRSHTAIPFRWDWLWPAPAALQHICL